MLCGLSSSFAKISCFCLPNSSLCVFVWAERTVVLWYLYENTGPCSCLSLICTPDIFSLASSLPHVSSVYVFLSETPGYRKYPVWRAARLVPGVRLLLYERPNGRMATCPMLGKPILRARSGVLPESQLSAGGEAVLSGHLGRAFPEAARDCTRQRRRDRGSSGK